MIRGTKETGVEKTRQLRSLQDCLISLSPYLLVFFFTFHFQSFTPVQAQEVYSIRRNNGNNTSRTNNNANNGQVANPFQNDTIRTDTVAQPQGIQYVKEVPDSVLKNKVFFFHHRPVLPKIMEVWHPTLAPTGIQFSDPLDALNGNYYLGKGVLGHPHVAVFPTLADGLEIQLMPDPNIGYAKRFGNINLYQTLTPYTVLSYNSSLNKDYVVHVAHTQNILPGWNIAMDYRLFSPAGIYTSTAAKDHYLDATMNYFSRDSRLQARGGIIWQSFRIDENGGIRDDSYFTQNLQSNRAGVPVTFYNMGTQHRELAAFAEGSYSFVHQFERYRHRDSIMAVVVNDSVTRLDTIELVDTIAAGSPHCLNPGTIGMELKYDRRKRVFRDSTWWQELGATVYWTNDVYPDHRWRNPLKLTLGLKPRQVRVDIEGDTMMLRSLIDPFANAEVAVGRGAIRGEAEMRHNFSQESTPDYRYALCFEFPFDSARNTMVRLGATMQDKSPDVRMVRDYTKANGVLPEKIASQQFALHFHHRDLLDFDAFANHMSHNIWYNSSMSVETGQDDLWLYQARMTMRLALGWLHLDMQQLLQYSTDADQMPVPLWASKNSLYADFHMFRRSLRVQIGGDVRYHTKYYAPGYDPATGLFFHQDATTVGGYIWADLFININVKRASFYVKGGHINALWDAPNYFILPHYPGQQLGLFWGITWHFFD